jgi:hypothetical protein
MKIEAQQNHFKKITLKKHMVANIPLKISWNIFSHKLKIRFSMVYFLIYVYFSRIILLNTF